MAKPLTCTHATVNDFLMRHDRYIRLLVRRQIPRQIIRTETLEMDIDEIVQQVSIKLWHALQRHEIDMPRSYINKVIRTVIIDMARRYKAAIPLYIDDEGELFLGELSTAQQERMQTIDPSREIEQTETVHYLLDRITATIHLLPPRQRYAIICSLKEQIDSLLALTLAFKKVGIDIEGIGWPEEKKELQSLKSSRTVAQKKLRSLMKDVYALM